MISVNRIKARPPWAVRQIYHNKNRKWNKNNSGVLFQLKKRLNREISYVIATEYGSNDATGFFEVEKKSLFSDKYAIIIVASHLKIENRN